MRVLVVLLTVLLAACPPADKEKRTPDAPAVCAKVGQNCEISPGKLGTCVAKDGCTDPGPACFVCQSQH